MKRLILVALLFAGCKQDVGNTAGSTVDGVQIEKIAIFNDGGQRADIWRLRDGSTTCYIGGQAISCVVGEQ